MSGCLFHEKYQKPKILQGFFFNLQNSGNSHEILLRFNLKKNFCLIILFFYLYDESNCELRVCLKFIINILVCSVFM